MAAFQCACPSCHAVLRAAAAPPPGLNVKCPKCGKGFVPIAATPAAAPPPKPTRAPAAEAVDDEVPEAEVPVVRGRTSYAVKRKKGGAPLSRRKWLAPALAGGGALIALIVILIATSGNSGPEVPKPNVGKVPDPGKSAIASNQPRKNPPTAKEQPAEVRQPEVEIPPLPPVQDRPFLVLDPGGHTAPVKAVLFTPDGKRMVSAAQDKTIRVWDVESGEAEKVIHLPVGPGNEGAIHAAALSPDGKKVAVGGFPFGAGKHGILIHLANLESGQVERVLKGHTQVVSSLAFSSNGKWLASAGADNTAIIYDSETGGVALQLKGHTDRVNQVVFHPSGDRFATASSDQTARIWFPGKGDVTSKELKGHHMGCTCLAWSPDGSTLATGAVDGCVRLWSKDGEPIKTIVDAGGRQGKQMVQITSLNFNKNGELLYTGIGFTGRAGILDPKTEKRRIEFEGHTNTVQAGSISADGTLAATTGGDEHETFIWKTEDGTVVQKLAGGGRSIWALAWSPDGKSLFWGNTNRGSLIPAGMALERGFRLDSFELAKGPVAAPLRALDKLGAWTLEQKDFFTIVFKRDGREEYVFKPLTPTERIYSATLLNGDRAIIGGAYGMYLLDLKEKRPVRAFKGHTGIIVAVAPSPDGRLFASGSSDQTIRFWAPDREEPVLSLFVADREWIAWTPEGYYTASAGGERLMGWQVNNGVDEAAACHPAIRFRASLYQPDVVRNLFRTQGSLAQAVALAVKERNRPIANVNLTQVLPPVVSITTPRPAGGVVQVNQAAIEVTAMANSTGNQPVKAIRLLVDGRPWQGKDGVRTIANPQLGKVEGVWKIELTPGKHTLQVQAESAVSKGVSTPLDIMQAAGQRELPNLYMLAVGVSKYPGPLKLNYAASDAQLIVRTFQEKTKGVFAKVEVQLVTDKDATKEGVMKGLDWLGKKMTAKDVGVFFFSGHGAKEDDDSFYLVPVDIKSRDVAGSCVSGDAVRDKLADMPGRLVAILDACHSGAAADSFKAGKADNLVRELLTDDCGVVVMCSSLGSEFSMESPVTQAGFFTHGLVEGLGGRADINRDGFVFINEANVYAALRVKQLSGGEQNPILGRSPNIKPFALTKR